MPTMTLSFFRVPSERFGFSAVSTPLEDTNTIMTRSLSASIACVASLASTSAFVVPQTSHVPTLQSRPSSCAVARTMPSLAQQTIMGVATTSASATLITDDATVTSGLAEIDDSNFRDLFDGDKAVLIDACAPWCGPCKLIKPVVERAADKWANAVEVVKYDVEQANVSNLKAKLDEMGVEISALPTLILVKDGQHISSRSGVVTDMDVNTFLSRNLHKARTSDEKQ